MNSISLIQKAHSFLQHKGRLFYSRRKAHSLREKIVANRGYKIVDKKGIGRLKSYAKKTYDSSSYWPWLALYTEIRGEFKEGWIPNDFYTAYLLKRYNPKSARISDYKTFDYKMFPGFALEPLITKIGNIFYDSAREQITNIEAKGILLEFDSEVVLKEDLGYGGHKVEFIQSKGLNFNDYSHLSSYIIQPAVQQHNNLSVLNSKAVSTVRVLTYLNEEGDVDVKYTYLRFGVGKSRVDNTSSGGGFCFINQDATLADVAYNKSGFTVGSKHPDSEVPFKSVVVPGYKKILTQCIASHKVFPYFRFIGWDVAIAKSGKPILLEWNSKPSIWMIEALQGPLFKSELIEENSF
jgi:hypothetical protein